MRASVAMILKIGRQQEVHASAYGRAAHGRNRRYRQLADSHERLVDDSHAVVPLGLGWIFTSSLEEIASGTRTECAVGAADHDRADVEVPLNGVADLRHPEGRRHIEGVSRLWVIDRDGRDVRFDLELYQGLLSFLMPLGARSLRAAVGLDVHRERHSLAGS